MSSELPIEQMVKDAHAALTAIERGDMVRKDGDLACHVLALAEENERLRKDLAAEKASRVHTFRRVTDNRAGAARLLKDEAGEVVGIVLMDLPEGPHPEVEVRVAAEERLPDGGLDWGPGGRP